MAGNIETNTRKIVARLVREGWISGGGAKHEKFTHPNRPGEAVIVPRHRTQKIGTARSIAKAADWL